jgi:REP element-mobilizing transposase RayT
MRDGNRFRQHLRLPGFDYRANYAYFVTLCVRDRLCVFGNVVDKQMALSRRGMVARDCWLDIPSHHPHVTLDGFIVMPNHVHGLLLFEGDAPVVATPASPLSPVKSRSRPTGPTRGSLGAVMGSYKSAVTRTINRLRPGTATGLWQHNFYEHIVRDDFGLDRVREYMQLNPERWAQDSENPEGDGTDQLEAFIRSLEMTPRRGDAGVATTKKDPGA